MIDTYNAPLNEIIKGRRSVTPDTALRLSRVLDMSAYFWLGLQQDWDLWHAMNSPEAKQIDRLKPIPREQHSVAYRDRGKPHGSNGIRLRYGTIRLRN
ncbi:HigA family addiction module antitoxin [Desulfosarcina sp.]|nr:HigA family addiction module antitoxin [Desulfosarcina sp.]